ncbi:MAG: hypothetical protein Q9181_002618 [Wetmoreana brouardii]
METGTSPPSEGSPMLYPYSKKPDPNWPRSERISKILKKKENMELLRQLPYWDWETNEDIAAEPSGLFKNESGTSKPSAVDWMGCAEYQEVYHQFPEMIDHHLAALKRLYNDIPLDTLEMDTTESNSDNDISLNTHSEKMTESDNDHDTALDTHNEETSQSSSYSHNPLETHNKETPESDTDDDDDNLSDYFKLPTVFCLPIEKQK